MVVASFHLARFASALAPTARVPLDRRTLRTIPGLRFARLLGTGRGRTMTASADLKRWAVFAVWDDRRAAEGFRSHPLWRRWDAADERFDVLLRPLGAHGSWGGANPIADVEAQPAPDGPIAVLTRATVRWRRLPEFLRSVPAVDAHVQSVDGLVQAVGIGEIPVGRQATFSLWRDAAAMQAFAYRSAEHREVIRRTRERDWYGEEWFARFAPISWSGTWDGEGVLPEPSRQARRPK